MFETAILAFTTLFATVGPIDVAVMYAALSAINGLKTGFAVINPLGAKSRLDPARPRAANSSIDMPAVFR